MRDRFSSYQQHPETGSVRQHGSTAEVRSRGGAVPVFYSRFLFSFSCIVFFLVSSAAWAATPSGTTINNVASATFTPALGSSVTITSNLVPVTTMVKRTKATIEFLQYAPDAPGAQAVMVPPTSYSPDGNAAGPFSPVSAPTPAGSTTALDLTKPLLLISATQYHAGEPVFVRVVDGDQNNDPAAQETVVVTLHDDKTGDTEVLRLTETGPNTGVFTGVIQSSSAAKTDNNGVMNLVNDSHVTATYVDPVDPTDSHIAAALVDPYGIVFNSATGLPVDGATITLVDAATGGLATVYGDDGVSTFPSSLTTGGTAADSNGKSYAMSPGGYRFPFIKPGRYHLAVIPPSGYKAPSTVATAALQALPGAPFAIAEPGSRSEDFPVNAGPAIHIDVPIDPLSTRLYLIKSALKDSAAIGDFVPYKLTAENIDKTAPVPGVTVTDRLPVGFRYRKGSARLNGSPLAEPVISDDGRSITFTAGDIGPGGKAEIGYVAEVGAGASLGKAVNTAVANGSYGVVSNTATATVLVTEDLYMSRTTIVGSVLEGCDNGKGIAGVRIFLEDGSYVTTDKNGMYHFAAVKAGTHVVQLDTVTVPVRYEIKTCDENTRFAGTPFSQFVDLQGGALWRADFHLGLRPKAVGEVGLELKTSLVTTLTGTSAVPDANGLYTLAYSIPIQVGAVAVRNLRLVVMPPDGVVYSAGSSRLDTEGLSDPEVASGVLTYRLGERAGNWEGMVLFNATIPAAGSAGDLPTKALLMFDTPDAKGQRTPVADTMIVRYALKKEWTAPDVVFHPKFDTLKANLSRSDKKEIEKVVRKLKEKNLAHITVIGHTDSNKIRPGASKEFPDNYALSRGRAKTVADIIAKALLLTPDQVTIIGKGPDEPIATNKTAKGRLLNRRVELRTETRHASLWTEVRTGKETSGVQKVSTVGLAPGEVWKNDDPLPDSAVNTRDMPDYPSLIEKAAPGNEWLWPPVDGHPAIASIKVAIKHAANEVVKLLWNGTEVDPVYFEGTATKSDNTAAISIWRGVHIEEGDNLFEAVIRDANGAETGRLQRTVHYSGVPVKAVFLPDRSKLAANGRDPVELAVRFLDKDGHPSREGVIGEYTVDPPFLPQQRVLDLQQSTFLAPTTDRQHYVIGADGVALIEIAPTTQPGEAVLHVQLQRDTQEIRAWLKPEDRDWILVGLAEGTVGYDVVKGNMETFLDSKGDDKYYEEDRVAFYAKGRIKGEWLLTLAYDSRKDTGDQQSLYQTIDPNKYYTLYGDGTMQGSDAASAKHIYVKLERDQFYALFGDFNAGLSVTELARYNRNLTGFKSEMKGDLFDYTLFTADTNQAHVRDEIPGDGTSGLYHLSRKNIVLNSEAITIETRDRFRSEVVVSKQQLTRFLDYTIDYDSGTIFFKSPVYNRDGNFNPIFIVAEYESFDDSDTKYNYGGRGAVHSPNKRVEVGASYVHEGQVGGSGTLEGVDAKIALSESDTLRAEMAETRSEVASGATTSGPAKGSAYLAELQHRTETLEGRVYVREQQGSFGLGQQNNSETGTRKVGTDLNYRINKSWTAGGEVFEQNNLATGDVRDMAELRSTYTEKRFTVLGGVRRAEDTLSTGQTASYGQTQRSDQVFLGTSYQLTDRLTMRARRDQSIGANDNVDFPTKTVVGADYKLSDKTSLFAEQEWSQGAYADAETTRVGLKTSPWTGGQLGSSVEQQSTENGVRLFSTTGLKQTWQITKQWSVDAGLDRSETLHKSDYTVNPNVPPASGNSEDFTAVSLGVGYREEKWSWTARGENRISDSEHKSGVYLGANGEVRSGLGLAAGLQSFRTVGIVTGEESQNNDLRLAVAYRPFETRYVVLDRLDLIRAEQHGGSATIDNNQRIVNNLVTNIRTDSRTQLSVQYACKYARETIDDNDYRGYTDLIGLEGRYDITKKWDVGLRGLRLHSWSINQEKYGTGASVGFNAGRNMWISLGYNFTGFKDRDFSKADFTSEGPFIKLRMKFDQASARDAVKWFSGQ